MRQARGNYDVYVFMIIVLPSPLGSIVQVKPKFLKCCFLEVSCEEA